MGCNQVQSKRSVDPSWRKRLNSQQFAVWCDMRNYSWDGPHFNFLVTLTDEIAGLDGEHLNEASLGALVLELKRFFFLHYLLPADDSRGRGGFEVVPPPLIDRLWCLLISASQVYEKFCISFYNGTLARSSKKVWNFKNYDYTRAMYLNFFGQPHPLIWPDYPTELWMERGFKSVVDLNRRQLQQFRNKVKDLGKHHSDAGSLCLSEIIKLRDAKQMRVSQISTQLPPFPEDFKEQEDEDNITDRISFDEQDQVAEEIQRAPRRQTYAAGANDEDPDIKEQVLELTDIAMEYKLSDTVKRQFCLGLCIPNQLASQVLDQYKKFLVLDFSQDQNLACPYLIRKAWRYHMAETEEYEHFCYMIFKTMITPSAAESEVSLATVHQLYQQFYGSLPPMRVWDIHLEKQKMKTVNLAVFGSKKQHQIQEDDIIEHYGFAEIDKALGDMALKKL